MSEDVTLDEFVKNEEENTNQQDHEQHLPEIEGNPSDWGLVTVEDISTDLIGGGTPSKSNKEYWGGEIPWASVKDLNGIELAETEDHITESGVENSATNVVPENSIVISTRMTVGEPFLNRTEIAINQDMKAILPDTKQVNPLFLVYSLWDKDPYLKSLGRGTTVDGITTKDLALTHLSLPSLLEQRKIATVLYTVDRAIEKVKEIREQVERVRAGTAQDLFRNGISQGDTKDTWLGEIPEDWDVVPFSEIVDSNRNGLYKSKDAYGEGSPIAKMGNALEKLTLDMSSADRLELTDNEKEKYGLKKGDLIFARRAQEVSAAGDCCYVPELSELTVFESSLIRVRLSERANPRFYTQYFDSPVGSRSIDRIVTEISISGVATSDLLDLKVAVPSPTEQREIASIMWQFDEQKKALKKEIEQYKRLKHGLQQDLLSGTVRTTDTNIEVPDEIAQHG